MIILSTPHCHTDLVDGKSTAEEMVLSAIDAGFVSLGFSEHGQQRIDPKYGLKDLDLPRYRDTARALGDKYRGQIRVHLGVERDFNSHADRKDFDYVLGACHYLTHDGGFTAVDGSYEDLLAYRNEALGGDGIRLATQYFDLVGAYAREYRPDLFAHFDLIKKQNRDGRLYDPDDRRLIDAEFDALDGVFQSGAILEVNTGGMARGYISEPYPDQRILRRWNSLGGRVIAGSDCHFAPLIAFGFDRLPEYLRCAGFSTAWRLGGEGEDLFVEYPL